MVCAIIVLVFLFSSKSSKRIIRLISVISLVLASTLILSSLIYGGIVLFGSTGQTCRMSAPIIYQTSLAVWTISLVLFACLILVLIVGYFFNCCCVIFTEEVAVAGATVYIVDKVLNED
jgi:hypothetical protein